MAIEKQEWSRWDDELSLVYQTFTSSGSPSSTDAIITMDDDEDETLVSEIKKTNNLHSNSSVPSTCAVIIIDDDDDEEETLDSKKNKKRNHLDSNSLIPSTEAVIIINDDEGGETLEPTKKKPRLGSWWDNVDAFDQLSCVVKGLPTAQAQSCFSSTNSPETKTKEDKKRSLSSSHHENLLGYTDTVTSHNKEYQDCLGYGHVSLPSPGGYVKDMVTPADSCFPSLSTGLRETKTNTNKDYESRLSSSNHHVDDFIDIGEDDNVGGSNNSSNKGFRHVSLEELGVSVEDLKSMPWEAFDPTWEIRSVTMDPWLGGYVSDMFSAH